MNAFQTKFLKKVTFITGKIIKKYYSKSCSELFCENIFNFNFFFSIYSRKCALFVRFNVYFVFTKKYTHTNIQTIQSLYYENQFRKKGKNKFKKKKKLKYRLFQNSVFKFYFVYQIMISFCYQCLIRLIIYF